MFCIISSGPVLRRHLARFYSAVDSLGRVFLKWFARRASRFGYHGTRTVEAGFRRRDKVPSGGVLSHPPTSGFEHASTGARDSIRKWYIARELYKRK